jgi:tripartite-type tricarboxylate transporter receptor subunit TctC
MKRRHVPARPAIGLAAPARAQSFDRPSRLVVPFAPGATREIPGRILAPELTRRMAERGAMGPAPFQPWLAGRIEAWGRVMRADNIKLD